MIFSPIKIGSLEVSNRIVVAPMCQYSAINGIMIDWHTQHLMQLGYSAAGLVMVEATAVEEIGRITHNCVGIYDNGCVVFLNKNLQLANSVAPNKSCFGMQSAHA